MTFFVLFRDAFHLPLLLGDFPGRLVNSHTPRPSLCIEQLSSRPGR